MAVYTEVSDEELVAFVGEYDIGEVVTCKGIAEGVENSNYLLGTTSGTFILTLFERRVRRDDLPFFLGLIVGQMVLVIISNGLNIWLGTRIYVSAF